MVQLDDERRFAALQTFDQGDLPQRTGPVECGHRRAARELEHRFPRAGRGSDDPVQVPAQVEMRVIGPPGDGDTKRGFDDVLAERRHQPRDPVHAVDQNLPVRGAIQPVDDHDGRAERGVAFHVPRERVARAHIPTAGRCHLADVSFAGTARAGPLVPGAPPQVPAHGGATVRGCPGGG
jgi:hypothetical protein